MNCPRCESDQIRKMGFRITTKGKFQRHQCKKCGHVFVPNPLLDHLSQLEDPDMAPEDIKPLIIPEDIERSNA